MDRKQGRLQLTAFIAVIFTLVNLSVPLVSLGANRCPIEFKKTGLCASLTWKKNPTASEIPTPKDQNSFDLVFWKKKLGGSQGPFIQPQLDLKVQVWMPSMGHGSMPTRVSQKRLPSGDLEQGKFEVDSVLFTMPGAWELKFFLSKDGVLVDQALFNLSVPNSDKSKNLKKE